MTRHFTPWVVEKLQPFDSDVWELYDGSKDWTQARNLAKQMPEKLRELQRPWLIEATKYNVIPLDDRRVERFNADIAGRPQLVKGNSQLLFGGMGRLSENSVVVMKNKSFSITAELEVPEKGAEGVLIAQGGKFGGLSLYAKGGKAKFAYNFFGLETFTTEATQAIPAGKHQVRAQNSTIPLFPMSHSSVVTRLPTLVTLFIALPSPRADVLRARSCDRRHLCPDRSVLT